MTNSFYTTFQNRTDLKSFGDNALLLFALQAKLKIDDIIGIATSALVDGNDDHKIDLFYVDKETNRAIIAQGYFAQNVKTEAPANKAHDLNAAVSMIFNRPQDIPNSAPVKIPTMELVELLKNNDIETIHIWFVHNCYESENVKNALKTVEHTAENAITQNFPEAKVKIQCLEVGQNTLEGWYKELSTPILVSEGFDIPIEGGYEINENDWSVYSTAISADWLYTQYKTFGTNLFSANIREFFGSRKKDSKINHSIGETAKSSPQNFYVYNNGITAIVNSFEEKVIDSQKIINIVGISIVNGAQTTGSIGALENRPNNSLKVAIRFIKCNNPDTVLRIIEFNNSQNKVTAADFKSNDSVQKRLKSEFGHIPNLIYLARRGNGIELIKQKQDEYLPSVVAGQVLAAFHQKPKIAYNQKTEIWEDEGLYHSYFNEKTSAKHIFFCYSLLRTVEQLKIELVLASNSGALEEASLALLNFLKKRGAIYMFIAGIAKCMELVLGKKVVNHFDIYFKNPIGMRKATEKWKPLITIFSAFTSSLDNGLSDGIKNEANVQAAITDFKEKFNAVHKTPFVIPTLKTFADDVN